MAELLSEVWGQVTAMLAAGVSLIPVRDRDEDGKPPKTPYAKWKEYQQRIITAEALWHQMEQHNTMAVAMICGAVSGNLEAIDIDVKNWAGIDGLLFEAIRGSYPQLWELLRIHSTPSGGFHILYRTEDRTGTGNQKLATAATSTQAGIETRGEGGYIVAPPSLGYQVWKDQPIPVITNDQRGSLLNLARSLNEKIKVVEPPTMDKKLNTFYDENPFEAFNHSDAAESVLIDNGWTREGIPDRSHRYFTRPGKDRGISASFNLATRLFYIFTTSTGLEAGRGYHPATLLSLLRFNGDKRATYQYLVQQGYGRINVHAETKLVRSKVLAGDPLPANASAQAKVIYLQTADYLQKTYAYGVYWEQTEKGKIKINREQLYLVAAGMGFCIHNGVLVWIDGYTVHKITARYFFDAVKAYNVETDAGDAEDIRNAFEAFVQGAGEFSISRIRMLDTTLLLSSTKKISYKCYSNGFVTVTATDISFQSYDNLAGRLVWAELIQPRDFHLLLPEPSLLPLYHSYLDLAIGISFYLWQIIGYLAHDFKDETMGYIIVLTEMCEDPRHGGGSGKNLFGTLLSGTTTIRNIPGSQMQYNEKFMQAWNYERILIISDVPKRFDYSFLKEHSTGSGILKKLYHDEITVPVQLMPKFVISTQHSFEVTDGGLKRRLRALEFTDFFTKAGGIRKFFGKMFPYDWSPDDWAEYDYLIMLAIQYYLSNPEIPEPAMTEGGWRKQYDQNHMPLTRQFIEQHWEYWVRVGFVPADLFRQQYESFCVENNVATRYRLSSHGMNAALSDWALHHKTRYNRDYQQRLNTVTTRGKYFGEELPF